MATKKQKSADFRSQVKDAPDEATLNQTPANHQMTDREERFLLLQYSALREEILKRIELQHQLVLGSLVAIGTILTVSTQSGTLNILLLYPFLALFLAMAWSQNDRRVRQITRYLSKKEELFLTDPTLGWEHIRTSTRLWIFGSRKVAAARGVFVGSQVLTLLIFGLRIRTLGQALVVEDGIIIVIAILSTLLAFLIIGTPSRKANNPTVP